MADSSAGDIHNPTGPSSRSNALANIQYASIIDDLTPSEDESPEAQSFPTEDAQSVIGVSISQAQTRLTSPKTPAAEKAAALDDLDGGGLFDNAWEKAGDASTEGKSSGPLAGVWEEHKGQLSGDESKDTVPDSIIRLPSPWKATPRKFQRLDETKASLREGFSGQRKRALSGGPTAETLRKYLTFNLPSMPSMPSMPKSPHLLNFSLPGFSSSSSLDNTSASERAVVEDPKPKGLPPTRFSSIGQTDGSSHSRTVQRQKLAPERYSMFVNSPSGAGTPSTSTEGDLLESSASARSTGESQSQSRHPKLRRSASDNSLLIHRSLSRASSLGDDSRFEHVQEQVNSRLKAIKDSWQDANFKLPSMPMMPNFSFGTSREDFFKARNASTTIRPSFTAPGTKRASVAHPSALAKNITLPSRKSPAAKSDQQSANAGMTSSNAAAHPFFTSAVQDLTGDVVVLGGYRGSILRSAEPPNRQLWVPIKVGLNLRKVDLEVGLNPEDEENMEERIIPDGMLTNIGPVDISKRLLKRLRASENAKNRTLRVHNYGYDWRLSPHLLARKLTEFLKNLPCNTPGTPPEKRGAIVVAHSLGGLITRHVINQRPELVSGVIYAGVPQTCVNILGPLRNGDDVLLSSRVLTAQVNFTIRTSYALLPLDGKCFFDKYTKEQYPVDFFDVKTWIDYCLSPCVAPPHPPLHTVPSSTSISGLLNSMSSVLPIIGRKGSISRSNGPTTSNTNLSTPSDAATTSAREASASKTSHAAHAAEGGAQNTGFAPQMGTRNAANPAEHGAPTAASPSTATTLPHRQAVEYLARTLAEVKRFKQELAFNPDHAAANRYPPVAVIYGKSTPTVYGAKVEGRDGIRRADAYDELAFASGDGVVLARAAMVPEGYSVVRGGVVSSDRGHVTLLGDLEAVGRCLAAVIGARRAGVGKGVKKERGMEEIEEKPE
ncbi:hypothetical protein AOQ84DRAFT_352936 [Glonium stellatum]|uniref:Uncharacterized protein n=1 Tax=Glonium stellatum TaxID=574774 RepID=A0A8E2F6W3_9PEZI|nr:hypothetical protein AOQ84DRAFT_352936 [Glonium stellatum]